MIMLYINNKSTDTDSTHISIASLPQPTQQIGHYTAAESPPPRSETGQRVPGC